MLRFVKVKTCPEYEGFQKLRTKFDLWGFQWQFSISYEYFSGKVFSLAD